MIALPVAMTADELADLIERGETTRVAAAFATEPALASARTRQGETALHVACRTAMAPIVTKLIALEADVNARDLRGRTPLHAAVAGAGSLALPLVDVLLIFGADRTVEDDEGLTPEALARREMTVGLDRVLARLHGP